MITLLSCLVPNNFIYFLVSWYIDSKTLVACLLKNITQHTLAKDYQWYTV